MKYPLARKMIILLIGSALLLFALTACAGRKAQTETAAAPEKAVTKETAAKDTTAKDTAAPQTTKLAKNYTKVMCYEFSSTPEVAKSYPKAAGEVQHSMMSALGMKNAFQEVGMRKEGKADGQTLQVKATITELRLVSTGARVWGGAFAGRSHVALDVELIDGATQKTVHQEKISSANNAWGASYTGGSSDKTLLSNTGKIIADYIAGVNPSK